MSMLRRRFSNHLLLLFRKIVYRIKRHLKMINALHERKTYQPVNLVVAGDPQQNNGSARNSQPDRYQLATDRNQLTTRNSQLTDINSQLTNINCQLVTDN